MPIYKIFKAEIPLKEPYWKHMAFGTPVVQLRNFEFIQTECDYINTSGELEYPYVYQIECKVALSRRYLIEGKNMIIPIKDWFIVGYR